MNFIDFLSVEKGTPGNSANVTFLGIKLGHLESPGFGCFFLHEYCFPRSQGLNIWN